MSELTHYDFEYGLTDWRAIGAEIWQDTQDVLVEYDAQDDGTLNSVTETTSDWCSHASTKDAGGWLYDDGKYYKEPEQLFQPHTRVVTTYAQTGPNTYSVLVASTDLLTEITTTQPVQYVDGQIPKAPRRNSQYSRVFNQPASEQLVDECIDANFVPNAETVDLTGAEDEDQANDMMQLELQLQSAIHRTLDRRYNPLVKLGDTVLIDAPSRGVSRKHLLWSTSGSADESIGKADATHELLDFTR